MRMLSVESGLPANQIRCIRYRYGDRAIDWIIESLIDTIRQEIMDRNLNFPPIWYKEKIDPSSGKIRRIGIQDVKQQIYDYIAVEALKPIEKRIGVHQYASIKNRGPVKGARQIRRWMRNRSIRYIGKADIRKCFESIDRENLMAFLGKYVANEPLLWLVRTLLYTFEVGLSIGSFLSQFLCNLYISQLYHEIGENMYRVRRHRDGTAERINLVMHTLLYMDDIFICGSNAKDLHKAMKLIHRYAEKMGLSIKENWIVEKCEFKDKLHDDHFIDMMGFRVYRWHMTIRRRVFKRIRRAYMRALRCIQTHKPVPIETARRCSSFFGQLKNTDSHKARKKYKVRKVLKICKRMVRKHDKGKVLRRTGTCAHCGHWWTPLYLSVPQLC